MTQTIQVEKVKATKAPKVFGKPWNFLEHPAALYVDLFCGLGGATTGGVKALERMGFVVGENARVVAVNHDPAALEGHAANHPNAEHIDCDIETLDPASVLNGQRITVLWGSAPCQDWSVAANGPTVRPQKRATPDYIRRWIQIGQPLVYIEENVWEITEKWDGWMDHVASIEAEGYRVEWKKLNAADYGTPQARERLILIARRGGGPIAWPKKTHANPLRKAPSKGVAPWRGAGECIDFSQHCPSFFEGKKSVKNQRVPYSEKVRARIGRYIRDQGKFWYPLADAVEEFSGPVPLVKLLENCPETEWPSWVHQKEGDGAVTLKASNFVVGQHGGNVVKASGVAAPTVATAGYINVGELRCIIPPRGRMGGDMANQPRDVGRAGHVVLAGKRYGNFVEARLTTTEFVLPPMRTKDGELNKGRGLEKASWTTTARGGSRGHFVEVHVSALNPVILPHHGENVGQLPRYHETSKPCPTVPASRTFDAAFPFIYTHNGKPQADDVVEPSTTVSTKNRHYIVMVRLDDVMVDVGYRQLTTRETAAIQGFPRDVKLTGTLTAQQRGIGNAVPPPLAEACVYSALNMSGVVTTRVTDWGVVG